MIIGTVLLRGPIYRCLFRYAVIGERRIGKISHQQPKAGQNDAIDRSLENVAELLHFSTGKVSSDPEMLIKGGPANCIGYAALYARTLQSQLESQKYKVTHAIARIHFLGRDVHLMTNDPFWKDHDIVIIEDLMTGEKISVDPTLYDMVGIGRIELKD